jgi:hypothetical protein
MTAHRCKTCSKPIIKEVLVFDDGKPKHRECMLAERRNQRHTPAENFRPDLSAPTPAAPTPAERVKSQTVRTDVTRQPNHRVVAAEDRGGFDVETNAGTRITPEPVPLKEAQQIADKASKPKSKDKPTPKGRK